MCRRGKYRAEVDGGQTDLSLGGRRAGEVGGFEADGRRRFAYRDKGGWADAAEISIVRLVRILPDGTLPGYRRGRVHGG